MTSFMQGTARNFMMIKAARQIIREIEKAGLANLKILADAGHSIVGTYLDGCSAQEKTTYKRDLNVLMQMGVTPEMLLSEICRQKPELAPIIEGREAYRKSEIEKLTLFLKEG